MADNNQNQPLVSARSQSAALPTINVATRDAAAVTNRETTSDTVEMWKSDDHGVVWSRIVNTSIRLINSEGISDVERCAHYFNIIVAILPDLFSVATEYFAGCGYSVTVLNDAALAEANILQGSIELQTTVSIFGQLVIVLFKNISRENYTAYMTRRVKALDARIGRIHTGPALSQAAAESINRRLRKYHSLRQKLLRLALADQSDCSPYGRACSYITQLLEWTDMTPLVFIRDTLLETDSPVLDDPRVAAEVERLATATEAVESSEWPQYYRIFNPVEANRVLGRNNFPILSAVAQTLYAKTYPSARNYRGTAVDTVGDAVVKDLVEVHERGVQPVDDALIEFLVESAEYMLHGRFEI